MRKAGEILEELSFTTSDGTVHSLETLKTHRACVIFFYPGDFTSGCTKEVCYFRDIYSELEEAGAILFGVSLDSNESHEKFREKYTLPFALISDEQKSLSKLFGVLRLGGLLKVRRATFVINPQNGEILDAFSNEFSMRNHSERVLSKLQEWKG